MKYVKVIQTHGMSPSGASSQGHMTFVSSVKVFLCLTRKLAEHLRANGCVDNIVHERKIAVSLFQFSKYFGFF